MPLRAKHEKSVRDIKARLAGCNDTDVSVSGGNIAHPDAQQLRARIGRRARGLPFVSKSSAQRA
jgi:hypothetical protein